MNISYNWLKDFLDFEETPEELSLILTDIGLEVESLEVLQGIKGGLEGLVVGHVLECEQHPNADRLKITKVDIGAAEPLPIVCGAPNVAKGQKVIVATVGTTLYPVDGEAFKIKKSKIRGEESEGMICAEDEIGIGKSHDGIIVLEDDAKVGTTAKEYYNIKDDYCYTIGLTPNRADATSHLGVARDIAAYFRTKLEKKEIVIHEVTDDVQKVEVKVENPELAPRYSGVVLTGLQVTESPDWLKERLGVIGIRSINSVVDITNYILHDLGQPLHAFDLKKISGNKVMVRKAKENEPFTTLDGVERKLSTEDLVIADEDKPMCIAGVFGGEESGVTEETTAIFLESAYFDAVSVRKTSKRHTLKTDSSFRFERGTDPEMTVYALRKAVQMLQEITGAKVSSMITDLYPKKQEKAEFEISLDRINALIGAELEAQEVKDILSALEINVKEENGNVWRIDVPTYRVDVRREVDVTEEILRIYGYNNIEIHSQIKASLNTTEKPDKEVIVNQISELLIGSGFREILSNSLTKSDYLNDQERAVKILNPLSSDLNVMRQNLLYSMLTAMDYNHKRQSRNLKFFEWGNVYYTTEKGYSEERRLSIGVSGEWNPQVWSSKPGKSNFYNLKAAVDTILKRLNIQGFQIREVESEHYNYALEYHRGPQTLVSFGLVSKAVLQKMDMGTEVYYADFNWDLVLKAVRNNTIKFKDIPKFPSVHRDLALLIDESVTFQQLQSIAFKSEKKFLKEVSVFDVYKGENLPEGKKSYALTFTLLDEEKTLTDEQIDRIINKFIINFGKEVGAEVR